MAAGWVVIGIGMAFGLYDVAFSTLAGLFGSGARGSITGITLIAGFASTIGWSLTAWIGDAWGWREACLAWAVLHIVLGLAVCGLMLLLTTALAIAATLALLALRALQRWASELI